eukprot:tig00021312_g20060.t1
MLGSAQLPALHHRKLTPMLASGVRIACTFESDRRQRARETLCNISPVGPVAVSWSRARTHARETAARERVLRRSAAPNATSTSPSSPRFQRSCPSEATANLRAPWDRSGA